MPSPINEVTRALKTTIKNDPDYKAFREKTTALKVLGHRLPLMQEIEREGFSFYKDSDAAILESWTKIWNTTNIHEVMYLPLFYYRRKRTLLNAAHWKTMKTWVNRIENWEHADALCYLYSFFFEAHPKLVEPTLRTWNTSKNHWVQRASIVSTIYYASKNRTAPPLKLVFELVEPLLSHKDPYVQKAVGWQLREAYKLDSKKGLTFIKTHLTELSAISFSYATEKIPANEKKELKRIRKEARSLS